MTLVSSNEYCRSGRSHLKAYRKVGIHARDTSYVDATVQEQVSATLSRWRPHADSSPGIAFHIGFLVL